MKITSYLFYLAMDVQFVSLAIREIENVHCCSCCCCCSIAFLWNWHTCGYKTKQTESLLCCVSQSNAFSNQRIVSSAILGRNDYFLGRMRADDSSKWLISEKSQSNWTINRHEMVSTFSTDWTIWRWSNHITANLIYQPWRLSIK